MNAPGPRSGLGVQIGFATADSGVSREHVGSRHEACCPFFANGVLASAEVFKRQPEVSRRTETKPHVKLRLSAGRT